MLRCSNYTYINQKLLLIGEGDQVVQFPALLVPECVCRLPHPAVLVQLGGRLPEDFCATAARTGRGGLPASEAEAAPEGLSAVDEGGLGARLRWRWQFGAFGGCQRYYNIPISRYLVVDWCHIK